MEIVKEAFQKNSLQPRQWLPPFFLEGPHRRRATFTAVKSSGKIKMGYYRRRSQEIIDIDSCLVIDPKILELKNKIKPQLSKYLKENVPTDFFIQVIGQNIEVTPNLFNRNSTPLIAEFGVLKVALPKEAFLQPTLAGEKALVAAVMKALPFEGKFADLFAGCGTFAGSMLSRGSVSAYESVPQAVTALSKAGEKFPLKVFKRDLFKNPLRWDELNRFDAVVFDPPRGGCPEQALEMSDSKVGTLIGVSCNPATFARDARILCEGGYWLQSLKIFDQFLWSHHVEMVGVFTKKKRVS
jgi:23S rRNA (uracil1939-C5)-methyltransferase